MQSPATLDQATETSQAVEAPVKSVVGRIELLDREGHVARSWLLRQQRCTVGASAAETVFVPREAIGEARALVVFGRRHTLVKALRGELRIGNKSVREWLIDGPTEFGIGGCRLVVYPTSYVRTSSTSDSTVVLAPVEPISPPPSHPAETNPPADLSDELRRALLADALAAFAESVLPLQSSIRNLSEEWKEFLDRVALKAPSTDDPAVRLEAKLPAIDTAIETLDQRVDDMSRRYDDAFLALGEQIRDQLHKIERRIEDRSEQQPQSVETALQQLHLQIAELQAHLAAVPIPEPTAVQLEPAAVDHWPACSGDAAIDVGYAAVEVGYAAVEERQQEIPLRSAADEAAETRDLAGIAEPAQLADLVEGPDLVEEADLAEEADPGEVAEVAEIDYLPVDVEPECAGFMPAAEVDRPGEAVDADDLANFYGEAIERQFDFSDEINAFLADHADKNEYDLELNPHRHCDIGDPATDAGLIEKHFAENYHYDALDSAAPLSAAVDASSSRGFDPQDIGPEFGSDPASADSELQLPSWFVADNAAAELSTLNEQMQLEEVTDEKLDLPDGVIAEEIGGASFPGAYEFFDPETDPEYVPHQSPLVSDSLFDATEDVGFGSADELDVPPDVERAEVDADEPFEPDFAPLNESDEDELTVEQYMQRLLRRVKGDEDVELPLPSIAPVAVTPEPKAPAVLGAEPVIGAAANGVPAVAPEVASLLIDGGVGSNNNALNLSNYTPRTSVPESNVNLAAMRALANETARSAIARSKAVAPKSSQEQYGKMAVSIVGFSIGTSVLLMNGLELNPTFVGMLAAYAVFLIWGFEATQGSGLTSRTAVPTAEVPSPPAPNPPAAAADPESEAV